MREFLDHTKDLLIRGGLAAAGFLRGLTGGQRGAAAALLALMVADYVSGLAAAALGKSPKSATGGLDSRTGARGILRKALMLAVVALAYGLDWFANEGKAMFSTATLYFYISNEGLSLLENLALCGVPVPGVLRGVLRRGADDRADDRADGLAKADGDDPPGNG